MDAEDESRHPEQLYWIEFWVSPKPGWPVNDKSFEWSNAMQSRKCKVYARDHGRKPAIRTAMLVALISVVAGGTSLYSFQAKPGDLSSVAEPVADLGTLPGNSCAITYSDQTVVLDRPTVKKTLRSVSANGNVLVFDPSPKIEKLRPGSVLLLDGLAILKVLATMPVGSNIAVLTIPGNVTDAVREAKIHWDYAVHFSQSAASLENPPRDPNAGSEIAALFGRLQDWLVPTAHAGNPPFSASGTIKDWDYTVSGSPGNNQIRLQMSVKKVVAGIHALIQGEGYLKDFDTSSDLEIHQGMLQDLRWSNKNLNGVMNFGWEVAKDKPGPWTEEDQIPLPSSFEYPFVVGGLPLTLSVTEALLVHPAMTAANQLSVAHFRLEYNGYQRFSVHSGNIDENGQVHGESKILDTRALSPGPGHAFVAALAGPRMELKFGVSSLWGNLKKILPSALAEKAAEQFLSNSYVQKALGTDLGATLKQALGQVRQAVKLTLKSDAAVHLDFILSASLLDSGPLAIAPCQRAQLIITFKAGANAEVFGESTGIEEKEIWKHGTTIGPKTGPCAASEEGT